MYVIRYLALSTVYSRGAVFHDSQVVADCYVAELGRYIVREQHTTIRRLIVLV